MSTEENKALVKKAIEANEKNDTSMIDELYTSDFVIHLLGPNPPIDLKLEQMTTENAPATFTYQKIKTEDMIAEGDKVWTRMTVTAKHTGKLFNIEPTGKTSSVVRFTIWRIQDGKIAEMWNLDNGLDRLQQMGVIPPTEELG